MSFAWKNTSAICRINMKSCIYNILILANINSNYKMKGHNIWPLRKHLWDKFVGGFDLIVEIHG